MPRSGLRWGALLLAAGLAAGCAEAPVTGRNQLMLIDDEQAAALGADAWQQIKSEMKVSRDSAARARTPDGQADCRSERGRGNRLGVRAVR